MRRRPAPLRLVAALLTGTLMMAAGESRANRILIPEEMSLSAAIDFAVPNDTLSLAPGTYERTPDPFIKAIVIEGRVPDDPPVIRRLEAGEVTLRHLHFEPDGPSSLNPILLRLLGSARLESCVFQGFGMTAIEIRDEVGEHDWLVVIDNCRFSELNVGIEAVLVHDGSRIEIRDTLFESSFFGINLVTPARDCPTEPGAEPPPFGGGPARIKLSRTNFSGMANATILARNAAWALDLIDCTIEESPLGIWLDRAGARMDRLDLRGLVGSSTGIRAISSRLEMTSSRVHQHAIGIEMTDAEGCERPAGVIGGSLVGSCRLDTNTQSLATTHPINADYNWWGTLICSEAQEFIQGVTVRFLTDATGTQIIECLTPVEPATWSRIKARLAP